MENLSDEGAIEAAPSRPYGRDEINARLSLVRHEIGHYIVARRVGFKISGVAFEFNSPVDYRGHLESEPVRLIASLEDVELRIKDEAAVLMAGAIGQSLEPNHGNGDMKSNCIEKARKALNTPGLQSDYSATAHLIWLLRDLRLGMKKEASIDDLFEELWDFTYSCFGDILDGFHRVVKDITPKVHPRGEKIHFKVEQLAEICEKASLNLDLIRQHS